MRSFKVCHAMRFVLLTALLFSGAAWASAEYLARVEDAIEVFSEVNGLPEQRVPEALLRDAQGIAIIPRMIKAGFLVGGRRGQGVLAIRGEDGTWSNPTFISMTGGSVGFQAGVQSVDVVLVFKSRRSIQGIVNGTFTLGADASVAAGPVGREVSAATDVELKSEIYTYSRSRGLFAGVALDGSKLSINHEANEAVYGQGSTPRRIFANTVQTVPATLVDFRDLLEEQTAN
jgi:lipid-binding SYLF domain-containing protein